MYVQPRHQIGCSRSIENRNKKHYQHFIIVNCSMNLRHEMLLLAFLSHPIIKLLFLFIFIFLTTMKREASEWMWKDGVFECVH